jgi:hypothetical protein
MRKGMAFLQDSYVVPDIKEGTPLNGSPVKTLSKGHPLSGYKEIGEKGLGTPLPV